MRSVRGARNPAQIARVECAKCRGEGDLSPTCATLCGDRECAKSRREGDLAHARAYLGSWKMRTGEWLVQLEYGEYLASWKMRTGDLVVQLEYRVSGELEDENWRLCSTTLARGVSGEL